MNGKQTGYQHNNTSGFGRGVLAAITCCGGLLAFVPSALAFDGGRVSCAIYGSGFVAVYGSRRCVRIGGRMRLDNSDRGFNRGFRGANHLPYAGTRGVNWPRHRKPAAPFARWTR